MNLTDFMEKTREKSTEISKELNFVPRAPRKHFKIISTLLKYNYPLKTSTLVRKTNIPHKTIIKRLRILDKRGIINSENTRPKKWFINNKQKAKTLKRRCNIDKAIELHKKGLSINRIANYMGLSGGGLKKRFKNEGIEIEERRFWISVNEYYKLKEIKDRPLNIIKKELGHTLDTIEGWLKHFGWFNEEIHKNIRYGEVIEPSQLNYESERAFFKEYKSMGKIIKLSGLYSDFLFQLNGRNILVEAKKQISKNNFPTAVLELLMGEDLAQRFFDKVDEKWIFSLKSPKDYIFHGGSGQVFDKFDIKMKIGNRRKNQYGGE